MGGHSHNKNDDSLEEEDHSRVSFSKEEVSDKYNSFLSSGSESEEVMEEEEH